VRAPERANQRLSAGHQLGLRLAHRRELCGELGAGLNSVTLNFIQSAGHVRQRLLDTADQLGDLRVLGVHRGLRLGAILAQLRLSERDKLRRCVLERAGGRRLHALIDVGLDRA